MKWWLRLYVTYDLSVMDDNWHENIINTLEYASPLTMRFNAWDKQLSKYDWSKLLGAFHEWTQLLI